MVDSAVDGFPRLAASFIVLLIVTPFALAEEFGVDQQMDRDPTIVFPKPTIVFSPKLKPLWLKALARPEADLKRQAAETISRAHLRGMPGLHGTIKPLRDTLALPDGHPIVRLAVGRALVVLDAKEAAPALFELASRDGMDASQLVEPALARWDYKPAREVWLARLSEPSPLRRRLLLAIRGLATVGETKAAEPLLQMATSRVRPADVRLEAARAVATLRTSGLETTAVELAADGSPRGLLDRLVSVSLLARHDGETARTLLLKLAVDREPAVAAIALKRLLELDPNLIVAMAERITSSGDANVRWLGARALVARTTPATIGQLGPMLDDPHPDVRRYVRKSLTQLAGKTEFDSLVREAATKMLATDRWRGLEQAAILLTELDHKPATGRLVELLEFKRPEVFVTAAWSLRKLAVPATLDAMLDRATRVTEAKFELEDDVDGIPDQVSQIFQAFGEMRFADSHSLLRRYIPKDSFPNEPRAAAVWALGYLYAGRPQADLAERFAGRLADTDPVGDEEDPENYRVRRMSAVSLGRMQAKAALPVLRQFYAEDGPNAVIGYACGWAIHQITGEGLPKPTTAVHNQTGWFLEPID